MQKLSSKLRNIQKKGGDGHFLKEEVFLGVYRVGGKDIDLMPIFIITYTH